MKPFIRLLLVVAAIAIPNGVILAQSGSAGVIDVNNSVQFMTDVSGKPLMVRSEYRVVGSPYYPEKYYLADIILNSGKKYIGIRARLNLMDNELLFMTPDGTEMTLTSPVLKIVFTDPYNNKAMLNITFQKNFPAIDQQTAESYYEVLDSGSVKLLKYHKITYDDRKGYNEATMTRYFQETNLYYLYSEKTGMVKLEKGKDFWVSFFNDKKNQVSEFIDLNDLKCRKETDWKKVIAFYNTLVKAF
jgi:hypothetical protein